MKIAFEISSYRLTSFVQLGLAQFRKLSPESELMVSDDRAAESDAIAAIANKFGALYRCSRIRRGHFAGSFQGMIHALTFAKAVGADIAVHVSQRFIFRKIEAVEILRTCFGNKDIMAATPGKPAVAGNHRAAAGFGAFGTLSDIVAIRANAMTPEQLLDLYRARLLREKVPWASFIEVLVDELHSNVFPGRTMKLGELTNPTADPIYLRRYQAQEKDYRDLALSHGFNGSFPLIEWALLERSAYFSKPVVI